MRKRPDTATGVIIINKPSGITSHDVVNRIRRAYNMNTVGHTGTLDPMATGVLPILLGRAVKASEYLTADSKRYIAVLKLGITTDTQDVTGNVLHTSELLPSESECEAAVKEFIGDIKQLPPMYSAIKIGGRKLVDIARSGGTVDREARSVHISDIKLSRISDSEYSLDVICSKGTYIRTLCNDIGDRLGCGGAMASLERIASGSFTIGDAITLDELEAMTLEKRILLPLPIERCFSELKAVHLSDFFARLAYSGNELYLYKLKLSLQIGERVRLYQNGEFFALGEVREYKDGAAIKPIKLFKLADGINT